MKIVKEFQLKIVIFIALKNRMGVFSLCRVPTNQIVDIESERLVFYDDLKNIHAYHLSCVVRKPDFCICEKKDADQLRGNREADQRLCFRYTYSTIPLLPIYEISSL